MPVRTPLLREGYTTGTNAAAAAKAAVLALLSAEKPEKIELVLPAGRTASLRVEYCCRQGNQATAAVLKDAGDDPDITDGAEIRADACLLPRSGIWLEGGKGVGRVTKPGLEIACGQSAINPVPRRMIKDALNDFLAALPPGQGLGVTISIPKGEELARKTLNPRLGIVGGLSVLGTSGIVIPYSMDAYKACIPQSLKIARACGQDTVVITTGRRSERYAQAVYELAEECFVMAGDFIDLSLSSAAELGFRKAVIWGMAGKISKLAAGNIYTHISASEVDISLMERLAGEIGADSVTLSALSASLSAANFMTALPPEFHQKFYDKLCAMAAMQCACYVNNRLEIECVLSDLDGKVLSRANSR